VSVDVDAPSGVVWDLLVDVEAWPRLGPSVRGAAVEGGAQVPVVGVGQQSVLAAALLTARAAASEDVPDQLAELVQGASPVGPPASSLRSAGGAGATGRWVRGG
jgi:hypothetical protein